MKVYSEKVRFLCKYKINNFKNVENVKKVEQEELQKILNIRNRLYYKRQKLDNEKDVITKEIIDVTSVLKKVRKEIKLCDEICDNELKMKEQIKELDKQEQKKVKAKEEQQRILKDKKKKLEDVRDRAYFY